VQTPVAGQGDGARTQEAEEFGVGQFIVVPHGPLIAVL
jgi:hypothetical protein